MTAFTDLWSLSLISFNTRDPFIRDPKGGSAYNLRTEVFYPQHANRHTNREEEVIA